ncbi:PQQ-binding-like beta-propeller repeat protein [Kitasatospora sp. NPDC008115]|uniref:outer membrane protein assembly factor BamB family protein n=1 Tax=Kitasatospora sp. NPDC008115 TaxID=3364022 RepID=UPI0036ECD6DB
MGSGDEASWQWDEDDGGRAAGAPADVVSGGDGDGPRPTRRRLLTGAGVLAAGAAVWGVSRAVGGSDPAPPKPRPLPTRVAGPEPVWVHQGSEPMTPGRLRGRLFAPVYVTRAGLHLLDPETGAVTATVEERSPGDRPDDFPLFVEDGRLFTVSTGHVDARTLVGPTAGWSLPLPPESGGSITLLGGAGGQVYGRVGGGSDLRGSLFAMDAGGRGLTWSRRAADRGETSVAVLDTGAGRLLAWDAEPASRVTLLEGLTGRPLWSTEHTGTNWSAVDQRHVYLPSGTGGVRALRFEDGAPRWSVNPGRGEEWRALPPLSDGFQVYLLRDNGLVTAHAADGGEQLWQYRLPFRLDRRCRPLLTSTGLIVPGPADAGVHFVETASGRPFTTFTDSGPGVDVWSVSSDGVRLYVGHDTILYCLGRLPVPGGLGSPTPAGR